MNAREKAIDFIENETQFHLGFLPTEQSHPDSRTLEADFKRNFTDGVRTLQKIDRNVLDMARRMLRSREFAALEAAMISAATSGGRIVFSGCGATGRLSILLESMWRCGCRDHGLEQYADACSSIMTGGDYALVRSVEFFEDYRNFGRRQVAEQNMGGRDVLVAITEGGETSSVLGTCSEALERGAKVFLLFNNPAGLLAERLERSRRIINDPRVTVLDLCCGPMAVAGSTRMQATTAEQLIAGAALDSAFAALTGKATADRESGFAALLDRLEESANVETLASFIDFECGVYRSHGKMTYFTDRFMLDIFTDTTERSPTFMLPPFRRRDDLVSPPPWAFVKDPKYSTAETWRNLICREPRCLEWRPEDYIAMEAPEHIRSAAPRIGREDLLSFEIGNEPAADRLSSPGDAAVLIAWASELDDANLRRAFDAASGICRTRRTLVFGGDGDFKLNIQCAATPLLLFEHLAVKLTLNTISTGTMVALGRVSGNWMSHVAMSNKKLIDRGVRLIAELGGLDYRSACIRLFEAMEESEKPENAAGERESAVQTALRKLRQTDNKEI